MIQVHTDLFVSYLYYRNRSLRVVQGWVMDFYPQFRCFVTLQVVAFGHNIYGFNVDGNKQITPMKNWRDSQEEKLYQLKVSIGQNEKGQFYISYPFNNIRILVAGEYGNFQIWEIALVSQRNSFFVTTQNTYTARCCLDDRVITCPKFVHWPAMLEFLSGVFENCKEQLDSSCDCAEASDEEIETISEQYAGRVLWYNYAQGLGCINTSDGLVRVHWSQIQPRENGFSYLQAGEKISFDALREPLTTRGTSFNHEAMGVRVI